MKNIITLSTVVDYYKKNKSISYPEEIDQYTKYFITASTISAAILASSPLSAVGALCAGYSVSTFRISKLMKWLPDKFNYGNQGREISAKERYELMRIINFMIFDIAIKDSLEQSIFPFFKNKFDLEKLSIKDSDKMALKHKCKDIDRILYKKNIRQYEGINYEYANLLVKPLIEFITTLSENSKNKNDRFKNEIKKVEKKYTELLSVHYNSYLINFSEEFPEFNLWIDFEYKNKIIACVTSSQNATKLDVNKIINKIENLQSPCFSGKEGLKHFEDLYSSLFKRQSDFIIEALTDEIIESIETHYNYIIAETENPLIQTEDIDGIIFPKNKEAFIPHGFKDIVYQSNKHQNKYLKDSFWKTIKKKENIESFLLQNLVDPYSAITPTLILGNPGAGKSMLSKIFAGQLCQTTDFVPFYIKLRDVATSTTNVSDHVNKGLAITIGKPDDIDWLTWAKKFKNRIPVIILDGFDELLKSSNTDLNNYINEIKKLQKTASYSGVCVRIILTSRLSVMDNVEIPKHCRILRLEPFDEKRLKLWVNSWNSYQKKEGYILKIPKKKVILDLAQEPLLLFMLAVYDFENSELQKVSNDNKFNQSKLYDALMNKFTIRQLERDKEFKNLNPTEQENLIEIFRLRLGMIAILMFLNDTTHKDNHELLKELQAFGLDKPEVKEKNVLGGFFFIHENKSTSNIGHEYLNYEFLHKTFSEFLAADFLLRVAKKQTDYVNKDKIFQKEIFGFCFGYNWLHKHNNIVSFLFEHANHIIRTNSDEANLLVERTIKPDLENLFDKKGMQLFPISEILLLQHKLVIEHLAIYSQNIILLWVAINQSNSKNIVFEIYDSEEHLEITENEYTHEGQDRTENNKNKLLWKRIASLWSLVGNDISSAKFNEWVGVEEINDSIVFRKSVSDVKHYFSNSSYVLLNDFKKILSFFDRTANISNHFEILNSFSCIIKQKPELEFLIIDVVIYRFIELLNNIDENKLITWFIKRNLSRKQELLLIEQVIKAPKYIKYKFFNLYSNNVTFNMILKEILYELENGNFTDELNYVIKKILIKMSDRDIGIFHIRSNRIDTLFQYISLISKIYSIRPVLIEEKIFNKLILHLVEELSAFDWRQQFNDVNSHLLLEYLNIFFKLKNFYPLEKLLMRNESIYNFFENASIIFNQSISQSPQFAIKYLCIINNLENYFPVEKIIIRSEEHFYKCFEVAAEVYNESRYQNSRLALEYLELFKVLKKYFPIRKLVSRSEKFINRVFDLILSKYYRYNYQNPQISYEYLKLFNEIKKYFPINEFVKRNKKALLMFLGEISEHLSRSKYPNTQIILEYFELYNQLKILYPIEKAINKSEQSFLRIFDRLTDLLGYSRNQNIHLAYKYLKVIKVINDYFPNKNLIISSENTCLIMFKELSQKFEHSFKNSPKYTYEYIKLINELSSLYSLKKIIPRSANSIFILAEEIPNNIDLKKHKNIYFSLEYLKLYKKLKKQYPYKNFISNNDEFFHNFFDMYSILKIVDMDIECINELLMLIKKSKNDIFI